MKKIIVSLFLVLSYYASNGQCSEVSIQISASDTAYVQLYHAGIFLIPSGLDNFCEWEVTSFSGDSVFQGTTTGQWSEQSFVLFDHSIPITDSMKATLIITNNTAGISCTIKDTLYWNETEVLPGSFIGNWEVLSSNGGVEEEIITSTAINTEDESFELFPSPAYDHFQIMGDQELYSFTIFDSNGQILATHNNISRLEKVDISNYSPGMYFVQFRDENNKTKGVKKILKM
jgi:hypothetical protein